MNNYCKAGNLYAVIGNVENLPEVLEPYKTRLQALYDPPPQKSKPLSNSGCQAIHENILKKLVTRLNEGSEKNVYGCCRMTGVYFQRMNAKVLHLSHLMLIFINTGYTKM